MTTITMWTHDQQLEMLQLIKYSYEMTAACPGGEYFKDWLSMHYGDVENMPYDSGSHFQGLEYPGTSGRQLLLHGSSQLQYVPLSRQEKGRDPNRSFLLAVCGVDLRIGLERHPRYAPVPASGRRGADTGRTAS